MASLSDNTSEETRGGCCAGCGSRWAKTGIVGKVSIVFFATALVGLLLAVVGDLINLITGGEEKGLLF